MTVKNIHHINFLVEDLNTGITRYENMLGLTGFIIDDLPGRGVKTARIKLGDTWLVLVQPVDMKGVPGQHLQEHGEGFFLISYGVDSLEEAGSRVAGHGSTMTSEQPRKGLENWHIWDIDMADTFGAQVQFCQETPQTSDH